MASMIGNIIVGILIGAIIVLVGIIIYLWASSIVRFIIDNVPKAKPYQSGAIEFFDDVEIVGTDGVTGRIGTRRPTIINNEPYWLVSLPYKEDHKVYPYDGGTNRILPERLLRKV